MPIYEYKAVKVDNSCDYCRDSFEELQHLSASELTKCPRCKAPVRKVISAPSIGGSKTTFDDKAKNAGFHKLQKLGKGEYEKKY
ncbi:MAG: zinc ribbon domain-containing protein [Kiritimatiellae bacterium]|jgi:putative FmdB family regulatory protein|nr:zinc ribbon domain-containing protein [Kiritimatiellia bacterium]